MGTYIPPLPVQSYVDKQGPVVGAAWLNAIDNILQGNVPANGVYNSTFQSGQVQVTGPNGMMTSYGDLTFGLLLPNPSGVPCPALLIGGAGNPSHTAAIITDEQVPGINGINLIIGAGSVGTGSALPAGTLFMIGGAGSFGPGGTTVVQGGTSVHGPGGDLELFGGNSTDGNAGNVYIAAGQAGNLGGNVKVYCTRFGNEDRSISFWLGQPDIPHSVPLWTMSYTGALFPGSQGAGNPGDVLVSAGNLDSPSWGPPGLSGTISATLSGDMGIAHGNLKYCTDGRQVSIWSEQAITAGSIGPGDVIISTVPSFLIPSLDRYIPCTNLENGGIAQQMGVAHVDTFGAIKLSLTSMLTNVQYIVNAWTISAAKGITTGWCITYPL